MRLKLQLETLPRRKFAEEMSEIQRQRCYKLIAYDDANEAVDKFADVIVVVTVSTGASIR